MKIPVNVEPRSCQMTGHNMAFISAKLSCYLQKIRGCAKKHPFSSREGVSREFELDREILISNDVVIYVGISRLILE